MTAEFECGESSGLVDHLVVTPDAYHVVDYKTNAIDADEVADEADYYRTQMAVYAVALHQQSPDREVTATLYFTTPGEAHQFDWDAGELDELKARIESDVDEAMDATGL